MAYKGKSYISKVINRSGYVVELPNVGVGKDLIQGEVPNPYEESSTKLYPLGTKATQGERVWRYCSAGASGLNIGEVQQQAKAVHAEQDDDIAIGAASAVGSNLVTVTSTTNLDTGPLASVDGIAEGYIYFNVAAGLGQCYKIKGHEALVTTGDAVFELYDPLTIALTTSSKCGLVQNPYANVIASEAVVAGMVIGVPGIDVTATYYFWAQTGGPAAVAINTTIALGTEVVAGTTAAKGDPAAAATTEIPIGVCMTPGVTGGNDHALVFLTLDR